MNKNQILILEEFRNLLIKIDEKKDINILYNQILFMGLLSSIMNNKKIFKRNKHLKEFLEKRFGLSFPVYVGKSRPLLMGKTINYFLSNEMETNYSEELNLIYRYIQLAIKDEENDDSWNDIIRNIKL